jgi:hypothetical protein
MRSELDEVFTKPITTDIKNVSEQTGTLSSAFACAWFA